MSTPSEYFQKILDDKKIQALSLEDKLFLKNLSDSEKKELALSFLRREETNLYSPDFLEESFFRTLFFAEQIGGHLPEVLCQIALLQYRFSLFRKKGNFLFQALDKLVLCEELDPFFVASDVACLHLWGKVLIALAIEIHDESLIEKAIQKFAHAEKILTPNHPLTIEVYWDLASAWVLLSKFSGEASDLKKGIDIYGSACRLSSPIPHLRLDYADSLIALTKMNGDPNQLEEAISLLCGVIADTFSIENEPASFVYKKAWFSYTTAAKLRFELTHNVSDLEAANTIFREAALNVPERADVWINWGELFLHSGLVSNHLIDIETGLEKLTSSKSKECDPLKLSAFLSQGLILLGHLLEDLKLIQEGKTRVESALEIAETHPLLSFTRALAELYLGLYFSDAAILEKSISIFEKNLEKDSAQIDNWFGLFQAYVALGSLKKDPETLELGIQAISRLVALRPFSPIYLNEKGIALLKLKEIKTNPVHQQEIIEEAIETFKKGWLLNEDEEIRFNWGCAVHLLGECTGNEEDYLEAIEILTKVYEKRPSSSPIRYQLAIALSHYGELASNVESLGQAIDLFETLVDKEFDHDAFFCDFGYTLLNLAELVYDANSPERGEQLRREAEKKLVKAVELGSHLACYHLACLYSICELNDASMQCLQRAERLDCLPNVEDLEHDEWLEGVRKTDAFREFLTMHKRLS